MGEYDFLKSLVAFGQTKGLGPVIDRFVHNALYAIAGKITVDDSRSGYYEQLGFLPIADWLLNTNSNRDNLITEPLLTQFTGTEGEGFVRYCLIEFSRLLLSGDKKFVEAFPKDYIRVAKEYIEWKNQDFQTFIKDNKIEVIAADNDFDSLPGEEVWDQIDRDVNFDVRQNGRME